MAVRSERWHLQLVLALAEIGKSPEAGEAPSSVPCVPNGYSKSVVKCRGRQTHFSMGVGLRSADVPLAPYSMMIVCSRAHIISFEV